MTWIYILLALFAALNIGDGLSTLKFLSEGRQEGNAAARYWFDKIGVVPTIVMFKGITVGVVTACAFLALHVSPGAIVPVGLFLAVACVVMAYTILDNLNLD